MNKPPAEALLTWAKVVELGAVSRAAKALGISQPAVSARLKKLAAYAGGPLYVRTRQGLRPTPQGERLLPLARALSRLLETLPQEEVPVRIAASQTVAAYHLPPRLAAARASSFTLRPTNSAEALRSVREGEAEIAVLEGPLPLGCTRARTYAFGEDELVLAVPKSHPLARNHSIAPTDLKSVPLLVREPGSGTRQVVEAALTRFGVRPPVQAEIAGLLPLKEAVLSGIGAAFLPRVAIRTELRTGRIRIVRIRGLRLVRPLTLVLAEHADTRARALAEALLVS